MQVQTHFHKIRLQTSLEELIEVKRRDHTAGVAEWLMRGQSAGWRIRNSRSMTSQPVTFGSRGFESYPRRFPNWYEVEMRQN